MTPLPNAAESRLADVIRALGSNAFPSALHTWLIRCLPFDNIIVTAYFDAGRPQALYLQSDLPQVFAEIETTYLAGAYLLDPYHDLHLTRATPGVYRLRDIAPDQFHRSRYFQGYYQATTLLDELTFIAYPTSTTTLNVCLGRDAASNTAFSARDLAITQRIAPIVTALIASHWAGLTAVEQPTKETPTDQLIRAARAQADVSLSPRQAETALLILRGHSSVSIGLRLGVSAQTVKVFRKQLYSKCRISSQAELFALMLPMLKVDLAIS